MLIYWIIHEWYLNVNKYFSMVIFFECTMSIVNLISEWIFIFPILDIYILQTMFSKYVIKIWMSIVFLWTFSSLFWYINDSSLTLQLGVTRFHFVGFSDKKIWLKSMKCNTSLPYIHWLFIFKLLKIAPRWYSKLEPWHSLATACRFVC